MPTEREFDGHIIKVDDYDSHSDMRFIVSGPLFNSTHDHQHNRTFDSYKQAVEAIVSRRKLAVKQDTANLSLEVLSHDGSRIVHIKGIHARLGNLLFKEGDYSKQASESYNEVTQVYPCVAWIKGLLQERVAVQKRLGEINTTLHGYRIKVAYSWRHQNEEGYATAIEALEAEWKRKLEAAQNTNDQGQAA